ncbi:MAG: 3-deoxy-manno-octulosonate cytidylyltransferase [Calditrichaeota bacterium]|nr:3-deoxy-manno-octulosonate cytidylyltransferase [Calditrichota bacterium]
MTPAEATSRVVAVIPARFASTRLPGKMLADVAGKPLVARTIETVLRCGTPDQVLVATDDDRIAAVARDAGVEAVLTDPEHPSGSDRIHAAIAGREADIVVNVQGDEPAMPPEMIDGTVRLLLERPDAGVATAASPLDVRAWSNPNVVKIAVAADGRALYFSRAPIPRSRDGRFPSRHAHRHVGLYVFRRPALDRFCSLPPSPLEKLEKLEQLRLLEDGRVVVVHLVLDAGPGGVDTAEDLQRMRTLYADMNR